jgi:hypothetical protein
VVVLFHFLESELLSSSLNEQQTRISQQAYHLMLHNQYKREDVMFFTQEIAFDLAQRG